MNRLFEYAIIYFVEAIIAWQYYEYLFTRKQSKTAIILSFFVGYFLCFVANRLNITAINTLSFFIINFFLIYYNYECTLKTSLIQSAFLSFIMTFSEILIVLVLGLFGYSFGEYIYNFTVFIILSVLSKLLYFFISVISARLFAPHKKIAAEPRMMIFFCGFPVVSMIIALCIAYIGLNAEITKICEIMIAVTLMVLLVVNLVFFLLYNYLQKTYQEYFDLQLSIQKEKADISYYQALSEQAENQRILIHDINNHLNAIHTLAQKNEIVKIQEYIAEIQKLPELRNRRTICHNTILNSILVHYDACCEESSVALNCEIRSDALSFMDGASITALFENLLSNALTAANKSHEKFIDVLLETISDNRGVMIVVVNSCETAPLFEADGMLKSTKIDLRYHGYGIKSILRVVKKYHGSHKMYYDPAEKEFHFIIQFPFIA